MGARSGLPDVEVQLLRAVAQSTTGASWARTSEVLTALDRRGVIGPRAALQLVADVLVPWRRHLPLLHGEGNWGSVDGDAPAPGQFTKVALSPVGRLALAAEEGTLGPVPLGLVDGSWYRGGRQPPYGSRAVLDALARRDATGLVPSSPVGGPVGGELDLLLTGHPARLSQSATVVFEQAEAGPRPVYQPPAGTTGGWFAYRPEDSADGPADRSRRRRVHRDQLVVTELPYGVTMSYAVEELTRRLESGTADRKDVRYGPPLTPPDADALPVVTVMDDSSARHGVRLVAALRPGADFEEARRWLLSTWPLTTEVLATLPAPLATLVTGWEAGDGSGLAALGLLVD